MDNSNNKYNINMSEILSNFIQHGSDYMSEMFRILMNEAMKIEREQYLNAAHYEHSEERKGYANGFKPKTLNLRSGQVTLDIPQTRESGFYPQALEKGIRSERALNAAMAEMYIQGVSTRKISKIFESTFGMNVSSTQVSSATKKLDDELEKFKQRKLGQYPVLFVDAQYQRVRINGSVNDTAVLIAIGVNETGHREVLDLSVSTSEAEIHWRNFFTNLVERGLYGVKLIISDNHAGIKAARQAVFPTVKWQRCYFHLSQNAQNFARRHEERDEISKTMRAIFAQGSKEEAKTALAAAIRYWEEKNDRFSKWLEENVEESMTYFDFNERWWSKIRTSNCIERLNEEIKRRTNVIRIFPNEESCERLIGMILIEQHEKWMEENTYLKVKKEV